jgi:pimeloyl-ACP methyl ester carboxylesterase
LLAITGTVVTFSESPSISPSVRDALAVIHRQALELIVEGGSLETVLDALCDGIDALDPDLISSVLLADPDGQRLWPKAVAASQVAAFREWEQFGGTRFADLTDIDQPTLVVNGIHDEMISVANSYRLSENLPNAMLMTYPDAGHGALFQYHESFTRQASAFLASDSPFAPY